MPARIGRTKRSEKGLLTPDNCVVALIDHQPQMMFGVAGVDRQSIINNTVALGKAARVFDVPVVLTTVETKSFSGNLWPQIRAVFPEQPAIERSSMNAWDDKDFVAAIKATGRKKLVLAGLWTEVCVTFPSVQAASAIASRRTDARRKTFSTGRRPRPTSRGTTISVTMRPDARCPVVPLPLDADQRTGGHRGQRPCRDLDDRSGNKIRERHVCENRGQDGPGQTVKSSPPPTFMAASSSST